MAAELHTPLEVCGFSHQSMSSCLQVLDRLLIEQEVAVVSSMVITHKNNDYGKAANIVEAVANVIGLRDLNTVSMHATLSELGIDSLLATEVKQIIERLYDIPISTKDVRNLTFARLYDFMKQGFDKL